jgi:hypothetical protein
VQAFSGSRQGQMPPPWWRAWQRGSCGKAQWGLEGRPIQPDDHTGTKTPSLEGLLGRQARSGKVNAQHAVGSQKSFLGLPTKP